MEVPKWPKLVVYISFLDKETMVCEGVTKKGSCTWVSRLIKK